MAFDFPNSPTVNQSFTPVGGPTYTWNGYAWVFPTSALNDSGFRATKGGTSQTVAAANVYTKITLPTEELDRGGYYDAPNSRWTPPAGFVQVSCLANFSNSSGGFAHYLCIYKNGVATREHYTMLGTSEGGFGCIEVIFDDYANGTDYYEAFYKSNNTNTIIDGLATYGTWFQGHITGGRGPQGVPGTVQSGTRVLIQSQIISTPVASVAFTTGIDATYDEYVIDFFNVRPASEAQLNLNISQDGGATWKTDATYQISGYLVGSVGSPAWIQNGGVTVIVAALANISALTNAAASGLISFYRPTASEFHLFMIDSVNHSSSGSFSRYGGTGGYAGNTLAFNGLRFSANGGPNLISGTFNLFGIKR